MWGVRKGCGWLISAGVLCGIVATAVFAKEPDFPPNGTPYAQAKASLLRQGLKLAPDKPVHPDPHNRELDCDPPGSTDCQALFLHKEEDGWRFYVLVPVDVRSGKVNDIHFAWRGEGHEAIPPPEPPDVPKLRGSYGAARQKLRKLGYMPIRAVGSPGRTCANEECNRTLVIREGICASDIAVCEMFWRAPDGRILEVMTSGEIRGGDIDYVTWSTWSKQRWTTE
ncbi:hypothetical protein [Asticcacaulis solisilvae]|uniref:hypothetical protein n=1 Tax=Asticcacaulis solisilvae TaxID=1217274 RepID=UPI003FD79275